MLGSIIKISKIIFAMFALRICANFLKYRYNYCIPDASRLIKGEVRFLLYGFVIFPVWKK